MLCQFYKIYRILRVTGMDNIIYTDQIVLLSSTQYQDKVFIAIILYIDRQRTYVIYILNLVSVMTLNIMGFPVKTLNCINTISCK